MENKLVEFKNQNNDILRGILTVPKDRSERGAIFVHGFERDATVEKKFRRLADALASRGVVVLRFDASGCGLSDGDFSLATVSSRGRDFLAALEFFKKEFAVPKIDFAAHSLGACVLAMGLERIAPLLGKILLLGPALDQAGLLRYYFVRDVMKQKDPSQVISWQNYPRYLDEKAFLGECSRAGKMMRRNYIGPGYFMEAKDMDFSKSFTGLEDRILHVQGDCDDRVPLESVSAGFKNLIVVKGGDHDLERPDFFDQWFAKSVDFLTR